MTDEQRYPVEGRSEQRNRQIAGHEAGHALVGRCLGSTIYSVTIVRDAGPGGFEGRCMRSGPVSAITFDEKTQDQTEEILSICERLERITPELGSARTDLSEYIVRCQSNISELLAGEVAESILHPDLESLGAQHDAVEARAFARVAAAALPATVALLEYCRAEAEALLTENKDILIALTEALIEKGTLSGSEVDAIIANTVTARSMAAERLRRDDWLRRAASAAALIAVKAS